MTVRRSILIHTDAAQLPGDLVVPGDAGGVVVFAHGSGSSRRSPRNAAVAERLNVAGLATLLFDLLTPAEAADRALVFAIELLAARLGAAIVAVRDAADVPEVPVGLFGASTGAAAALVASTFDGANVGAVVSRGGRPDLAGNVLQRVTAPVLLIVGSNDPDVLDLNRGAAERIRAETRVEVVPGATHLFEEPGALEIVADLATSWFVRNLGERVRSA
ncbi:MAG: dienelactone hydrolase family protein [Actinomycetota bacterium]